MNPNEVKMVGWSGLAYAIMVVITLIVTFTVAASAISTGTTPGQAPSSGSSIISSIVSLVANLVFCWMIFSVANYMSKVRGISGVVPIGLVIIVITILEIIGGFIGARATFSAGDLGIIGIIFIALMIIKGILLIIFGVKALQAGSGAWKGFAVLVIIIGALSVIIIGLVIVPFLWIAAGIVLMVAAMNAAKTPTAA